MHGTKPLAALTAGVALLALAACDSGSDDGATRSTGTTRHYVETGAATKDAGRVGPATAVDGATEGGTLTVYMPGAPGPDTLDPSGGVSVIGNAIQQALISRSLTQYANDENGDPVLVPDLATDLGRHNDDYTEWTFTIRDDATWEDGEPVTADEVAFGICRSLDATAFPTGPGSEYGRAYFAGVEDYDGPYAGKDPDCEDWSGVTVDGHDLTLHMSRPFPDMDYFGAFMTMGPAPLGTASVPPNYGQHPLANGPYKVERWDPQEQLVLVRNDAWDPASDPGRHQYPDRWVFEFNQDQAKVDEIMLSDSAKGHDALSTSIGAGRFQEAEDQLGERLVQTSSECVASLAPDYTKITDVRVRKALAYAFPYEDVWLAAGEVPNVTRSPASALMAPGMPGHRDFQVDGEQITYDPAKARDLLAQAGYGSKRYPITMIYWEVDPQARDAQRQITTGLEAGGFSVRAIPVQDSPFGIWFDPTNALNKKLNLRVANMCPAWPSGSAMLPALLRTGSVYNTAHFSEPEVDDRMDEIATLPADEQPEAWGRLDEDVMEKFFPLVPIAYVNRLFVFGAGVGNPSGDASLGTPNYKDLYVEQ